MQYSLMPFILSLVLTALVLPFFIGIMHSHHEGQQIRQEGPVWHQKKAGTPTMGGVVFGLASVMSAILVGLWQGKSTRMLLILLTAFVGYALIGFIDDGSKLYFKRNLGLTALQKLAGQVFVAVLILIMAGEDYFPFVLPLPFGQKVANVAVFTLFAVIWLVGFSNAVNLSDGLDGLATGLSFIAYGTYGVLAYQTKNWPVLIFISAIMGGLADFFIFNHKPAKIFMGDVGSLALGGGLAAVALFLGRPWSLLLIGIVFVLETLSVILQVISFKTTGKRIFKMTPIHHHFELLGWSEWKVDIVFWLVGLAGSLLYLAIW